MSVLHFNFNFSLINSKDGAGLSIPPLSRLRCAVTMGEIISQSYTIDNEAL